MRKNLFLIFAVLFLAISPVASSAAESFDFNDFAQNGTVLVETEKMKIENMMIFTSYDNLSVRNF